MNLIDELGLLKAQIAEMKSREEALKAEVILAGGGEGLLYRATVSETTRKVIDWRAVAEALGPSRQLITAHTSSVESTAVRVVARTGVVMKIAA